MKKNTYTVTVAISAYNEGKNVVNFLNSVINQKEDNFKITNIWVFNDGSVDNTVVMAKSVTDKRIEVFDDKKRIGKSSRLNQIYQKLTTDFLVQSDADVIFKHDFVVRDMIKPLINNKEIWMCGGHPVPSKGKTFTENAINCTFNAYVSLREKVRGGNNVFSVDGRLLSYKRELVSKIKVPSDMIANDAYTYFCCLTFGHGYKYVPTAIVIFRSPQNIRDQVRQNTRFLSAETRLTKHFDPELVHRESHVPFKMVLENIVKEFLKHPIMCTYIYVINRYCKIRSIAIEKKLNAKWDMAETSKTFK